MSKAAHDMNTSVLELLRMLNRYIGYYNRSSNEERQQLRKNVLAAQKNLDTEIQELLGKETI